MIEGLQIDVPSGEVKEILAGLVRKHEDKADRYAVRATELREHGDDESTIESFEHRENEHRSRAAEYRFMAEHVVGGETYRLTHEDLRRLEIVASRY